VQKFVRELREGHDATILLCTHDMAEAAALCDRVAILDKGRLVALDSVDGLQQRFAAEIGVAEPTLEDIFIHLTGRSIEDDDEGGNE